MTADPWRDLSRRVVMVARYIERDGIARYAEQLMASLRGGRTFTRVGLIDGPGDYHRRFDRGPRALWLLRDAHPGDDIVIQFHPAYFVKGGALARLAWYASWGLLGLLRDVTVVVHEPDVAPGSRIEEAVRRWAWRRMRRLVFHSQWERERHERRFGRGWRKQHVVVPHGDFFAAAVAESRAEARERLGLSPDRAVLVMIGYISGANPDKGYDRAVDAVRALADPALELHIVGSPIRPGPEVERLLEELRAAAAQSPQVHLHEQYVDDAAFDRWVRAADAVLTPYRSSSSSGVIARAQLLGTPVITSDVGGLAEQAGPGDVIVRDDDELLDAVRRLAAGRQRSSSSR